MTRSRDTVSRSDARDQGIATRSPARIEPTETEFQAQVVELARLCGWRSMHVRRSIGKGRRWQTTTSIIGWPDLILWRPGRFLAVELKAENGKLTAEQAAVLGSLRAAGVDTQVWFPKDWPEVQATLQARDDG